MSRLIVQDVLLEIFQHVLAGKTGRRDLATLARTCHAFHEPALKVLWHTLPSLGPLVLCFPRKILHIQVSRRTLETTTEFSRSPSLQEWERPLIHAKFIRVISRSFEGNSNLSGLSRLKYKLTLSTLETIFDSCPIPLLPGLQHFHYTEAFPVDFGDDIPINTRLSLAYLFKLSSPTVLRSLHFSFGYSYDRLSLLIQVFKHYSSIQSLRVDIHKGNILSRIAFNCTQMHQSPAVANAQKLSKDLVLIGSLQNITSLTFLTSETSSSLSESDFQLVPSFPAILELTLCSPFALSVLKVVQSPRLRKIRLSMRGANDGEADRLCIFVASRAQWQESMRSLVILDNSLSTQGLETLFVFKHLNHLEFKYSNPDDSVLERVAIAWPMLEHVCIEDQNSSHATFQSLVSFSRHCPHLRHLKLGLQACQIPPTHPSDASRNLREPVKPLLLELDPYSAMGADPDTSAEFLWGLFPGLTLVLHKPGGLEQRLGNEITKWKRLVQIIDQMDGVRRFEEGTPVSLQMDLAALNALTLALC
ncbi:hypothetical protein JVU11DRAFT_5980 [Chiua virens]|nr:hypothetical protein JVU11DRAFT_5980 [Chiua virens]